MTPEQQDTITDLAAKAHQARRAYEASRTWNMAGRTPAELEEQTIRAELLLTEMMMANAALSRAQIAFAETAD